MKLNITKKTKNIIDFVLEDSNPAFANTLRRYLLGAVPTMAIQDVMIENNTSGLFDEILAHRLGLIPLTFNANFFKTKEDCTCKDEGCSKCQVTFIIDKKGPCTVYTKDMKGTDTSVKPVSDNIPIIVLLEHQVFKAECIAELGYGSDHSKHQASAVGYKYAPKISLTGKGYEKQAMDLCPKKVFDNKNGKLSIVNADNCTMCMKCVSSEAVNVSGDDTKFVFSVESTSGKDAADILKTALEHIAKDAKDVASEIRNKC